MRMSTRNQLQGHARRRVNQSSDDPDRYLAIAVDRRPCGRRSRFDRYPVMLTPIVLVSRYCSKPSMPFWRPTPLAL